MPQPTYKAVEAAIKAIAITQSDKNIQIKFAIDPKALNAGPPPR